MSKILVYKSILFIFSILYSNKEANSFSIYFLLMFEDTWIAKCINSI